MAFSGRYSSGIAAILIWAGLATGCGSAPQEQASDEAPLIQLRVVREAGDPDAEAFEFQGGTLYLDRTPVFSDEDFTGVAPFVIGGELWVQLDLTPEAGARALSATSVEIGSDLAVIIEGDVLYTVVNNGGMGPRAQLVVSDTEADFDRLTALIDERWGAPR